MFSEFLAGLVSLETAFSLSVLLAVIFSLLTSYAGFRRLRMDVASTLRKKVEDDSLAQTKEAKPFLETTPLLPVYVDINQLNELYVMATGGPTEKEVEESTGRSRKTSGGLNRSFLSVGLSHHEVSASKVTYKDNVVSSQKLGEVIMWALRSKNVSLGLETFSLQSEAEIADKFKLQGLQMSPESLKKVSSELQRALVFQRLAEIKAASGLVLLSISADVVPNQGVPTLFYLHPINRSLIDLELFGSGSSVKPLVFEIIAGEKGQSTLSALSGTRMQAKILARTLGVESGTGKLKMAAVAVW